MEVVARQIPGRSKSTGGRSRGIEKSSILYSRLELAERLRLAWQNREKNKANINIFLARETLDLERCDSEISNPTTAPSSPVRGNEKCKIEIPLDNNRKIIQGEDLEEKEGEKMVKKLEDKLPINFLPLERSKVSVEQTKSKEKVDTEKEQVNEVQLKCTCKYFSISNSTPLISIFLSFKQISKDSSMDEHGSSTKKKQVSSTSLPSIKMVENSSLGTAKREDFSSAKQKRASFHSGANRAFLDPIRSATEVKWSSISEKNSFQKSSAAIVEKNFLKGTIEDKEDGTEEKNTWRENSPCDSITNEKAATIERIADKSNCADDKNAQIKTISIENKENDLQDDNETITPRETDRSDSTRKISSTSIENKDSDLSTIDKTSFSRCSEARSNTMNDRNPSIKKPVESQKIDQKSRRTNSAPPQRRFESISANNNNNNRVHVNVVIDSMRKNRNQKDQDMDCRYNTMEKIDTAVTKVYRSLLD